MTSNIKTARGAWLACVGVVLGLAGCTVDDDLRDPTSPNADIPPTDPNNGSLVVLTNDNRLLLSFADGPQARVRDAVSITGINGSHEMLAIDFRPSNGVLYGISKDPTGTAAQLYTINRFSGAATTVGAGFSLVATTRAIGMDFDPLNDEIRVVGEEQENRRIDPDSGTQVMADTDIAAGSASTIGISHTNSFPGAATSTTFVIDSTLDTLFRLGSVDDPTTANGGAVAAVGLLGVNVPVTTMTTPASAGFDIDGFSGVAYLGFGNSVYTVSLATGAATLLGRVSDGGITVRDVAVTPPTSATVFAVTGTGSAATLITFPVDDPATVTTVDTIRFDHDLNSSTRPIDLVMNETIVGIDFRPLPLTSSGTLANGDLFALTQKAAGEFCLYRVKPTTTIYRDEPSALEDPTDNDVDGDGIATLAETETATHDIGDPLDNCPLDANAGQEDADGDGIGDACEDPDGDTVLTDEGDNCPRTSNLAQTDADDNGIGDDCENTAIVATPFDLIGTLPASDPERLSTFGVQCAINAGEHLDDDDDPETPSSDDDGVGGVDALSPVGPTLATATGLIGFDFGLSDRPRVTSDTADNLRVIPTSGKVVDSKPAPATGTDPNPGVQPDENLTGTTTAASALAHTNNFPLQFRTARTPTTTTSFVIDPAGDNVGRIGANPGTTTACPNATNPICGVTATVGALGVDFDQNEPVSFDIIGGSTTHGGSMVNATGYAIAVEVGGGGSSSLYRINLVTGAATLVGMESDIGDVVTAATVRLKR